MCLILEIIQMLLILPNCSALKKKILTKNATKMSTLSHNSNFSSKYKEKYKVLVL